MIPLRHIITDFSLESFNSISKFSRVFANLISYQVQNLDIILILISFNNSSFNYWDLLNTDLHDHVLFSENFHNEESVVRDCPALNWHHIAVFALTSLKGIATDKDALSQ